MSHNFSVDALSEKDFWWLLNHQHLAKGAAKCTKCGLYEIYVYKGGLPKMIYKRSLSSFNPFKSYSEPPPCI